MRFRDQSSNPSFGKFLVSDVGKKPSPIPRSQSIGKMDRPSHYVMGPYVRARHGVRGCLELGEKSPTLR